jgi:hypothetical protein
MLVISTRAGDASLALLALRVPKISSAQVGAAVADSGRSRHDLLSRADNRAWP